SPGDQITSVKITFPADANGETPDPLVVKLASDPPTGRAPFIENLFVSPAKTHPEPNWPTVLDAIQFRPDGADVELTVAHENDEPLKGRIQPIPAAHVFGASRRL